MPGSSMYQTIDTWKRLRLYEAMKSGSALNAL